ncbi:MAG: 3-phenylpropionate/cinnamic acid dioxygenase subunit beta [Thermodesulfobacteriota bacterium]|jgi:3-phenylpropionate/cinnamic acid dioxygenase small subunit
MGVHVSDSVYREICEFLYLEADLLDAGRFREWLALLTDDVRYRMPVRVTRERGADTEVIDSMTHFDEDRHTLEVRIRRLETGSAWAEDPPSRTRHFVSNVRVQPEQGSDEVKVQSNLLLYRNRGDAPHADLLSAVRQDVLRRVNGDWRLARRTIVLDQSTIATLNLAVLL